MSFFSLAIASTFPVDVFDSRESKLLVFSEVMAWHCIRLRG